MTTPKKTNEERMAEHAQGVLDLRRHFLQVFDTESGKIVLQHLDVYAHSGFPNYNNVNATYAQAGKQEMVAYIIGVLRKSKEGPK